MHVINLSRNKIGAVTCSSIKSSINMSCQLKLKPTRIPQQDSPIRIRMIEAKRCLPMLPTQQKTLTAKPLEIAEKLI